MPFYYTYEVGTGLIVSEHQQDPAPEVKNGFGVVELDESIDVFRMSRAVVTADGKIRQIPKPEVLGSAWDGDRWVPPEPTYADLDADARAHRENLFSSTSWYIERFVETGIPIPPGVSAYRQALRDITKQPGYPFEIDWPVAPE